MEDKGLVLVSGATGYLGSHVVLALLEGGYRVRGSVRSIQGHKNAHLQQWIDSGRSLELVEADLLGPDTWPAAVKGCKYVVHVASPFVTGVPEEQRDTLVKPAVEGTMNVLKAAAAEKGVKRLVLTSSVAAIAQGWGAPREGTVTEPEKHWSVVEKCDPYYASKTLAEKAAWDYVQELKEKGQNFELAVINPTLIIGPTLSPNTGTSIDIACKILRHELPAYPDVCFGMVDVRDVAKAHVLAMTNPSAAGERYVCNQQTLGMRELALIAAPVFRPLGYKISTMGVPTWLLRIAALVSKEAAAAIPLVGNHSFFDNAKVKRELGVEFLDIKKSFVDMCHSLIEHGIVSKTPKYEAWKSTQTTAA